MKKDPIYRERLLRLADFLEHEAVDEDFNFNLFLPDQGSEPKVGCGTACCAMGWTPYLFPELGYSYDKLFGYQFSNPLNTIAEDVYGLDMRESQLLFHPEVGEMSGMKTVSTVWYGGEDKEVVTTLLTPSATRKEVADNIRTFLSQL